MWETNSIKNKGLTKTYKVCKHTLPGFLCDVQVDLEVARFANAICMTAVRPQDGDRAATET